MNCKFIGNVEIFGIEYWNFSYSRRGISIGIWFDNNNFFIFVEIKVMFVILNKIVF